MAPSWRTYIHGSFVEKSDQSFTDLMTRRCAEAGVPFKSYRDREGLDDSQFRDMQHVNKAGAPVLTRWIAEDLRPLLR